MLNESDVIATIAVSDLQAATRFYEEVLGLKRSGGGNSMVAIYESGRSKLLVYQSKFAGTNQATAATWIVREDLEGLVDALKSRGVPFEHYDMPGVTRTGEIHTAGGIRNAWFKDPDGNIFNLVHGSM